MSMLDEVKCPICLDTLKKPIRMLSCGHNLCHSCMIKLCGDEAQRSCPNCRATIVLGPDGVESFPRNHVLENLIDKFSIGNNSAPHKIPEIDTPPIHSTCQLADLAESYIKDGKFKNAAEILKVLIDESEPCYKILPSIKRADCLFKIGDIDKAKNVCAEMISILMSCDYFSELKGIFDECYLKIQDMTKKFIKKKECDVAIGLVNALYTIIKDYYNGENKLISLERLGLLMEEIAEEMLKQKKAKKFRPQLQIMDKILDEMQSVGDVDIRIKCLEVTWFLKYIGFCCNQVKDYTKSIDTHKQAIAILKTVFGEEAKRYRVLGLCYHNMAFAFENSYLLVEAESAYKNAIDVKTTAVDYSSNDVKNENILFSTKCLNIIMDKLSKS